MTIGELEEMCNYLGREYGNDTPIYAVIDDFQGNRTVERLVDMTHDKNGYLMLFNYHRRFMSKESGEQK